MPFAAALDAFRAFLDAAGVDARTHYVASLAFEERGVDVLRHAGIRPDPGQAVVDRIEYARTARGNRVEVTVRRERTSA